MTEIVQDLSGAVLRANPRYRLVPFDELAPEQGRALESVRQDPALVAILEPLEPRHLGFKSVCRRTASLFRALAEPGTVPARTRRRAGRGIDREIAELVLDGVLEIESDGAFVSGGSAYPVVFGERSGAEARGRLARLSLAAVRYAAVLDLDDAVKLSARMYFFHRLPVTPAWQARWPGEEAVLRDLGFGPGGAHGAALHRDHVRTPGSSPMRGWVTWTHRAQLAAGRRRPLPWKLYLSPLPADLPAAVAALAATLAEVPCPSFKIGCDAYGLLRPDKVVGYFAHFADLQRFARALEPRLAGCAAHGVPFSAASTDDGLLSWGTDPPRDPARPQWMEAESWRLWITNHLARALLAARREPALAVEPARFALERLRLAGVETETWTPVASIWGGAPSPPEA